MFLALLVLIGVFRYAEMAPEAKNKISHRFRALDRLREFLAGEVDAADAAVDLKEIGKDLRPDVPLGGPDLNLGRVDIPSGGRYI